MLINPDVFTTTDVPVPPVDHNWLAYAPATDRVVTLSAQNFNLPKIVTTGPGSAATLTESEPVHPRVSVTITFAVLGAV
jgi:hypothetical protein